MDKYSKYILGYFSNESAIAITVECLNTEYTNVTFEATETGKGNYELSVVSKNGLSIHNNALHTFKNVSWVLYESVPVIEKLLKGDQS